MTKSRGIGRGGKRPGSGPYPLLILFFETRLKRRKTMMNGLYNYKIFSKEEVEEMEAAILAVAETWKAQQEAPGNPYTSNCHDFSKEYRAANDTYMAAHMVLQDLRRYKIKLYQACLSKLGFEGKSEMGF
jgi:hypothetical protein